MNSPERDAALEIARGLTAYGNKNDDRDLMVLARQLLAMHEEREVYTAKMQDAFEEQMKRATTAEAQAAIYRKALTLRPMDSFQENDTILALCKRDNEFYRVQFAWTEDGGRQFMCDMDLPRFAEHELEGGILSNDLAALAVRGEKNGE